MHQKIYLRILNSTTAFVCDLRSVLNIVPSFGNRNPMKFVFIQSTKQNIHSFDIRRFTRQPLSSKFLHTSSPLQIQPFISNHSSLNRILNFRKRGGYFSSDCCSVFSLLNSLWLCILSKNERGVYKPQMDSNIELKRVYLRFLRY